MAKWSPKVTDPPASVLNAQREEDEARLRLLWLQRKVIK